jgi:cephalosporin-C deacetylase-like acetyl esterase
MKQKLLAGFVLWFLFLSAGAQDPYKIMDWKTEYTLRAYLLQKMHKQYDLRRDALTIALKSEYSISLYRDLCRKKYINLLGDLPQKTRLNANVTKTIPCKGYNIENVIYESRPGHHVASNLYLPDGKGPFPAILMFCGHEMTSKATESYQKSAILFASNGFVVLVVDPISQGERVQFTDSLGNRILRGSTTEHTLLNAGANMVGTNIVAWELFDNVRSLDYLISRPEVDPERIGCLGNSGGGAQTAYFIGFDDRIKVAAPCSNIASRERNYELSGVGDGCQQIPFEGRDHLEIADFLIMFAPKPLLILAGRYDFVDYTGTENAYKELKAVYNDLGAGNKISLFTYDDGHGLSKPKREAAVTWFRHWLCNDTTKIIEKNIQALDEKETNCTSTGQVNSCFKNEKTVQEINLQTAQTLAPSRNKFLKGSTNSQIKSKIKELLAIDESDSPLAVEITGGARKSGYSMRKLILRREGEVPLPCLVFVPDRINPEDTIIIWLNEKGKSEIASNESIVIKCMNAGNPLLIADLRGMGETEETPDANDPKYYNHEYNNAILSLHTGKPIIGQRVEDVFTLLGYITTEPSFSRLSVKIRATGAAAPVALYSAILKPQISRIEIPGSIRSYMEILERPMEKEWYSYVIPDVLKFFDMPDLQNIRPELKVVY